MRSLLVYVCIIGLLFADNYPLYIRFIPYNPPNLHLNQQRATNAYYLPSFNQGVTYNFTQPALNAPVKFASGPIAMRLMVYRVLSGCAGTHTVSVEIRFNISGVFTTVASTVQTINIPTSGNIVPGFDINGLSLSGQYQLQAGDYVQVRIRAVTGKLCLVNEYPLGGTDNDATHILLQTAPDLLVSKSSSVVEDPVNGTSNPKRIPGAKVRYSISITNSAQASGTAESVIFSDPIPSNMTYIANTINIDNILQSDTADGDSGSFQGNSVNAVLGNMVPGATHTIVFDTRID